MARNRDNELDKTIAAAVRTCAEELMRQGEKELGSDALHASIHQDLSEAIRLIEQAHSKMLLASPDGAGWGGGPGRPADQ